MRPEPEFITIVEGPPPEFKRVLETWPYSLLESAAPYHVATCDVRSLKGEVLRERCERAWREGRPMRLDFPTLTGLRRQLEIVSVRLEELPEGDLFHVWVRHRPEDLRAPSEGGD